MNGLSTRLLDIHDDAQIADLVRLHGDYSLESMEAGGSADGFAVAWFLRTMLFYVDGEPAGFFSFDPAPPGDAPSIELIYVAPTHRRRGIAELIVGKMKAKVPTLELKSPLSPACAALAEKLGVPGSVLGPSEQARMREGARFVRKGPSMWCSKQGHRREHAFTACAKCTAEFPRITTRKQIEEQVALIRLTGMAPGQLRTLDAVISAAVDQLLNGETPVQTLIGWAAQIPEDLRPHIVAVASARRMQRHNYLNAA